LNGPWRALAGLALAVGLAATAYAVRIQISERTMLDVCREVVRWRMTLSERALSDMGRASARAVAWRIPLRDGLTLGIPRAEVDGMYIEATGSRLDTFVLTFRGVAERSLTVSHRMGDLLAQRWSGDEPTYRELMAQAIGPEPPHLDCRRRGLDRKAALRASLAQAAAIVYLRVDSGAELFHTRAGNRTMVRRHYALENGDEWVDWNTLVPLGEDSGPPFATAHWRFSDAEIGAMAPMAEAADSVDEGASGTADPIAPAWVVALRDVILQRDADRLYALARDQHWSCAVARGARAPAWCAPVEPATAHATPATGSAVEPP
jgi:hypothetical protein